MFSHISTEYMMSVGNVFALKLQNTFLCCHYGYGKKEKTACGNLQIELLLYQ